MVELSCQNCGRVWDYSGQSDYYASCPNCKSSVKVKDGDQKAASKTLNVEADDFGCVHLRVDAQKTREQQIAIEGVGIGSDVDDSLQDYVTEVSLQGLEPGESVELTLSRPPEPEEQV